MASTTPKGFPFPQDADLVQTVDEAIESLATTIDTYLDGEAWVVVGSGGSAPAFQNSWAVAFGHTVKFRKDAAGNVEIRGVANAGASGTTAFTLPVGYRPDSQLNRASSGNGSTPSGFIVTPAGLVQPSYGTGGNFVALDGVFSTRA